MARSPSTNGSGSSRRRRARPDPGHQLGRREGLDDVVGRTRVERLGDGLVAAVAGDEDDRQVGELGNLAHQLDAVDIGQHQVEQHQPRPLGPDDARQVPRRPRHERGVAGHGERVADEAQRPRVVVHHQDARRLAAFRRRWRDGRASRGRVVGLPGNRQREGERGAAPGAGALGPDAGRGFNVTTAVALVGGR